MKIGETVHVNNCFGCSTQNPIGLKIAFQVSADGLTGEFTSDSNHEGPPGCVHGGILATILDEAVSYLSRSSMEYDIRTMKETITFRNAAPIGEKLKVEAKIQEEKSRAFIITAQVLGQKGIVAQSEATLIKVKGG